MDESLEFGRSRDRIADMLEPDREAETREDLVQEADIYVHPGYGEYSNVIDKTAGLTSSSYQLFHQELSDAYMDADDDGRPVAVLHPGELQQETQEYMNSLADGSNAADPVYIPTQPDNSRPATGTEETGLFSGEERLANFLNTLEPGATINLYGELRNQCYRNDEWLVRENKEKAEKKVDIEKQLSFPEGIIIPLPLRNIYVNPESAPETINQFAENSMQSLYTPERI